MAQVLVWLIRASGLSSVPFVVKESNVIGIEAGGTGRKLKMTKSKDLWIEQYQPCGCSADAPLKRLLLGYCKDHGGDRSALYKLPVKKRGKK